MSAAIKHTAEIAEGIPTNGAWLDTTTSKGQLYWEALQYVARWTKANHESIHARFLRNAECEAVTTFGNEHNFVWQRGDEFFHGKGATPAWTDNGRPLLGLIPLNMGSPILIALGADNRDYLSFAPHGAGRNESRTQVKRRFADESGRIHTKRLAQAVAEATTGLDIRWYSGKADVSETPLGYKNPERIKEQIRDFGLAAVIGEIQPLGCIMAGEIEPHWRRKKKRRQ